MSDIFLSYSSSEKERVSPIVQQFEQQGWTVWWDRKIPPGKTFDEVIEEALNAAKCVVVVWSAESVKSNWIKTEADEGVRRGILIPILIDDVMIPFEFRRIQAARLTDLTKLSSNLELRGLLSSISALISKPVKEELKIPESQIESEERLKQEEERKKEAIRRAEEEEAKRKVAEKEWLQKEEEAKRKAAEEEAKRRAAEEEPKKKEAEAKRKATEDARKAAEEERKRAKEERRKTEEVRKAESKREIKKEDELKKLIQEKSVSNALIIIGYVFAVLVCIPGIVIGLMMWKNKATINGVKYYTYNEESRRHGRLILIISCVSILIWNIISYIIISQSAY